MSVKGMFEMKRDEMHVENRIKVNYTYLKQFHYVAFPSDVIVKYA